MEVISRSYVLDIETNGLLSFMIDFTSLPYKLKPSARLWCVSIHCIETGETVSASLKKITKDWLKEKLSDATQIIAHNGIKFDFVALKLFGVFDYTIGTGKEKDTCFGREVVFTDTLLMSRLLNPDRYKGHSLENLGKHSGVDKIDFRTRCIEQGIIDAKAPKGAEFCVYSDLMVEYCEGDVLSTASVYTMLCNEMGATGGDSSWSLPFRMETKLADLAIKRETFGLKFDKELAIKCLKELTGYIDDLRSSILPNIPPKPMNKGELEGFTAPKNQLKKTDGEPTVHMLKFAKRVGAELYKIEGRYCFEYKTFKWKVPLKHPIESEIPAKISDLDHIKNHLLNLGWKPTEWRVRDMTKDSKKQNLPYEKRVDVLNRWIESTKNGKYTKNRLQYLGAKSVEEVYEMMMPKLESDFPVRVPTSPSLRVGVEKTLCPSLQKLEKEIPFARDFSLYLTYRHRLSCIAGGDIEDMDFDEDIPNTGYLANYREEDGRIPTPAIEIGTATSRYKHISVSNIPRIASVYGENMRSLFGSGDKGFQFGYDFASLEARIMGHYVLPFKDGDILAERMLAEKPNDIHTVNAEFLGIERNEAKSINYGIMYGASPKKVSEMLGVSEKRGKEVYDGFWESMSALKDLRDTLIKEWEDSGCISIKGIDGRVIRVRSPHSLLNFLFQSAGVIAAKYVSVLTMQYINKAGIKTDPFLDVPEIISMIEYHDEGQFFIAPKFIKFNSFGTKEEAKEFANNWGENGQLSDMGHAKKYYFAEPNILSQAIEKAIKKTEQILSLRVNLGYAWIVGRNWAECH